MIITIDQIKDFTKFTYTNELKSLCKPFFDATPVNALQLYRLFPDGSRTHLSTDPRWVDMFYNDNLHEYANFHRNPNCYESGIYIWDLWSFDSLSYQFCGKIAADDFNHAHGISIVRKQTDCTDIIEMAGDKYNHSLNEFYFNNIDLINKFIDHLLFILNPLLEKATDNRLFAPLSSKEKAEIEDSNIPTALVPHDIPPPTEAIRSYNLLTNREKECLLWLIRGKTAPEIAIILGMSHRTAEKHIASLKNKFQCSSLFQMGIKLSSIKLRLFFEEMLNTITT